MFLPTYKVKRGRHLFKYIKGCTQAKVQMSVVAPVGTGFVLETREILSYFSAQDAVIV